MTASMKRGSSVFVRACRPNLENWPACGPFLLVQEPFVFGLLLVVFKANGWTKTAQTGDNRVSYERERQVSVRGAIFESGNRVKGRP